MTSPDVRDDVTWRQTWRHDITSHVMASWDVTWHDVMSVSEPIAYWLVCLMYLFCHWAFILT